MLRRSGMKLVWAVALVLVLSLALVTPALALDPRAGNDVRINAGEVINDDLYVSATTFTLDGTVKGDVVAAGETITINGTVEGGLLAAGRTIIINGTVKGTARVAGAAITLGEGAKIERDLVVGGFSAEIKTGGAVGRDLVFAGSQALVAGNVARRAWVGGNGFELRGSIGDDARIYLSGEQDMGGINPLSFIPNMPPVPAVANGLTLGPGAKIGGDLEYVAPTRVDTTGIVTGQVTYTEPARDAQKAIDAGKAAPASAGMAALLWIWAQVRRFIVLFLVGLLLAFVLPAWTKRLMDNAQQQPLPSLGWGFVALVAVFAAFAVIAIVTILLAILLGAVTLGGLMGTIIALGILATLALGVAFGIAVSYVAPVVLSYLLGRLIFSWAKLSPTAEKLLALFVGLLIYVLVTAIPCVGWLIAFLVALFGLGALWLWGRGLLSKQAPAA